MPTMNVDMTGTGIDSSTEAQQMWNDSMKGVELGKDPYDPNASAHPMQKTDPNFYAAVSQRFQTALAQKKAGTGGQVPPAENQTQSMFSAPPAGSPYAPKVESTKVKEALIQDLEYFDWKSKSTNMSASVKFLIQEALYKMDFIWAKEGNTNWNYKWNPLLKQGINSILMVSLDQLNGDPNGQRISSSKNPIMYKDVLYKVMTKAFEEYFTKYNKKETFQYIFFAVESLPRIQLFLEYSKEFIKKYSKFEIMFEIANSLKQSDSWYVALKNTTAKLKEEEGGSNSGATGTVMSSSFSDIVPSDAGRKKKDWKADWDKQGEFPKAMGEKKKFKVKRFTDNSINT